VRRSLADANNGAILNWRKSVDVPVVLDRQESKALHLQLTHQLRQAILDGLLEGGTRLPSTRTLSESLGVSRNVALAAYDELYAEGYTETRHGSGTFIVDDLPVLPARRPEPSISNPRWLKPGGPFTPEDHAAVGAGIDFRMGQPSVAPLPMRTWQQLWREMAMEPPPADYGPTAGYEDLRMAVAAYLGRSRGIVCSADDVIITSGATQALDLILRATLVPGDSVAHEEPGYPVVRDVLRTHGGRIVPVAVDGDGLQVECLPDGQDAPMLVYCTPSHQYPTGARMPVSRRLSLIEWANRNDSLVIEDDYDSEFRFDASPLPAMAGLDDAGRVVYIGTFSKMLSPALRLGYVVATPLLRERLIDLKRATDRHSPWPTQRVLASFLRSGKLESHIAKMRRYYAANRQKLAEAFVPLEGIASLQGLDAGLHAFLELDGGLNVDGVIAAAAGNGVVVTSIDSYFIGEPLRSGLLLGYGGLTADQVSVGAGILASAIRDEASGTHQE
jgi:GntR family transcriptional regulator / MocR family aminotransferase